jgi:hypothetical protein
MRRSQAIAWVVTVCAGSLRLSQAKTLAVVVAAAMRCQRISLGNLGRQMLGSAKHQIKRCWRFCANDRVESSQAMRGIVKRLIRKRKKPLLVALDWVDIKGYQTLMASAVLKGRSVPLCWASTTGHVYDGRIQPKVTVRLHGFHGKLLDYPVKKGIAKVLKRVSYRSDEAVTQSVVVRWPKDLPPKRDECRFLMTDLPGTAHQLCRLYAKRMTIEQLFRDGKSKRNGWALRDTQLSTPERLDRLLLILAIAYLLLCGLGLLAQQTHKPSDWCSASKEQCSVFLIGLMMLKKIKCSPPQAFAAVFDLSEEVAQKWG